MWLWADATTLNHVISRWLLCEKTLVLSHTSIFCHLHLCFITVLHHRFSLCMWWRTKRRRFWAKLHYMVNVIVYLQCYVPLRPQWWMKIWRISTKGCSKYCKTFALKQFLHKVPTNTHNTPLWTGQSFSCVLSWQMLLAHDNCDGVSCALTLGRCSLVQGREGWL